MHLVSLSKVPLLAWVPKEKLERSHYRAQALRRHVSPKFACGRSTRDMNEAGKCIILLFGLCTLLLETRKKP
jgi:hypothetical protein